LGLSLAYLVLCFNYFIYFVGTHEHMTWITKQLVCAYA